MDMQIRLAKPEDMETIIELQSEAVNVLSANYYTTRGIEAIIQTQARARGHQEIILVAEVNPAQSKNNTKIVGFACLSTASADINGIYVHPDRAREKIGTKLLQAIEEIAIEKKYRQLWVPSSLNAMKFYQANGYQKHFYDRLQLNNLSISVVMMSKQLIPLTEAEKDMRIVIFAIAIFATIVLFFVIANF
ncbi:MAG: N-acetyltransferase family protein [Spirulina sp.]